MLAGLCLGYALSIHEPLAKSVRVTIDPAQCFDGGRALRPHVCSWPFMLTMVSLIYPIEGFRAVPSQLGQIPQRSSTWGIPPTSQQIVVFWQVYVDTLKDSHAANSDHQDRDAVCEFVSPIGTNSTKILSL